MPAPPMASAPTSCWIASEGVHLPLRYQVIQCILDGTNDLTVNFPGGLPLASVTVSPRTSTLTVYVQPGNQSGFLERRNGSPITFELAGHDLLMPQLILRCSSAVTVDVMYAYEA